jgi:hypothetical protein
MATVTAGYTWTSGETVTPTKLNSTAAPTVVVADNEVTTAKILDANVTNAKLASGIDASKLTTGTLPIARIADGEVTAAKLAVGMPVQVVHNKTTAGVSVSVATAPINALPTTSNTQAFTEMNTTITPASSTNKVLVRAVLSCSATTLSGAGAVIGIFRGAGATAIHAGYALIGLGQTTQIVLEYLDSPATTSLTTYQIRPAYAGAAGWNLNLTPSGSGWFGNLASLCSMTLTEIKAS